MATRLASITFWNAFTWTAIESISMTLGPEFMKGLFGGVIRFGRASFLETVPPGALKQRL
jgi:hypothetical protein